LNGQFHRVGGPAVIYLDGTQYWYHKGEIHREGAPAIVCPGGYQEWFLNGKQVTREESER